MHSIVIIEDFLCDQLAYSVPYFTAHAGASGPRSEGWRSEGWRSEGWPPPRWSPG